MADAPPRKKGSFLTIFTFAIAFLIIIDTRLRTQLGEFVGYALDPIIGFGGRYPVLTIMIAGTLMVLLTTTIRHFTTDWLEMAKFQAYMRAFQKEFGQARKDNNTYKMKKLGDKQADLMQKSQRVQMAQMRTMPVTMLIVIPLFAWLIQFLSPLDYAFYTAPWNLRVDMWASTVFPHWILLYMTLSIPLGALVQKTMKFLSWKERWQPKHPEVHDE